MPAPKPKVLDMVDRIIAFETGELDNSECLAFFGDLIRTGLAWKLQGAYGRTAVDLIKSGHISESGEVLA